LTADAQLVPTEDEDVRENFDCLKLDHELCVPRKLSLTPFVQRLPLPPDADSVVRVARLRPAVDPFDNCKAEHPPANDPHDGCDLYAGEPGAERPPDRALQRFFEFPPVRQYEMFVRPFRHLFHPELMQKSTIWGYGNRFGQTFSPGPTFRQEYGKPIVVRIHNNLPAEFPGTDGFGIPQIATHLHNFHSAPESDGGPIMFYDTGNYLDHHYAMFPAGNDPREALGHLWYHDHRADFTSQNVYKGLAGSFLIYDDRDSNNERDRDPRAFRLPSGPFDVPLAVGDKQFDPFTHKLVFNPFDLDGFLGDHVTVNGAVAPWMPVLRRKYRFRIVNTGPSRIYTFQTCEVGHGGRECASDEPATDLILIGNDGNLLNQAVTVDNVTISAAERFDVVIDFSQFRHGDRVNLMNIADQTSGKGRTGVFAPMTSSFAQKVLQFRVVGGPVPDPSRVPAVMREKPEIPDSEIACERTFVFDNQEGGWTINGQLFNFLPRFEVQQGTAERWTIMNASRDWEHPIHIHLEEHQFEIRDGATPPDFEQMRKDVALLRPGDSITLTMRHRDWLNEYPMHCHNTVHEDHAMLLLWEVVNHAVDCVAEP
jgi:FtsP/CotA-like multicopper oxidase with cupredoxin domain